MKSMLVSLLVFTSLFDLSAKSSHLLLRSQGEGAFGNGGDGKIEPLNRAAFLPEYVRISVRPGSGIETLAAGFQFRFGSDTVFVLREGVISLHAGSFMMLSRKIGEEVSLECPQTEVKLTGIGTCMAEVEPNGGLKMLCILGRILVTSQSAKTELLPGELVFAKPGGVGLADKINVNLGKVVESSYLLSGFPNSSSFASSLASVADAQKGAIGKNYRAEIENADGSTSVKVLPIPDALPEDSFPAHPVKSKPSYEVPDSDPLSELLGRPRKRISSAGRADLQQPPTPRPFPSKLLRTD